MGMAKDLPKGTLPARAPQAQRAVWVLAQPWLVKTRLATGGFSNGTKYLVTGIT